MWSSPCMPRSLRRALALALACAGVACAHAQTTGPTPPVDTRDESASYSLRERVLRMTDFLDTVLPGTLGAHNVTLHFTPKFSDLRDREFMRYPIEVRYGATNNLEFEAGVSPYSPNPINSGRDHRWGLGEARLGFKYDLPSRYVFFFDKATVGILNRIPLGKPPIQLNDHYTHVQPGLAVSRTLRSLPFTTFYVNLSYDRSVKLTNRKPPPPGVTRRHVLELAPGLLYKPGELGYFAEYRFRRFQEPDNTHLGHEVQVGTIWDIPLWRTAEWNLPGKWQLELAYRYTTEQYRGHGQGITARVNWKTTLREVLDHVSRMSHSGN